MSVISSNSPRVIEKLLRAIAAGERAKAEKTDVIFIAAADLIAQIRLPDHKFDPDANQENKSG